MTENPVQPSPPTPETESEINAAARAAARAAAPAPPPFDPGRILTKPHQELNNKAMELAFFADREKRRGRPLLTQYWFRLALNYELENLAAYGIETGLLPSLTHRSAGWLALSAQEPALAKELAQRGLEREPHPMIQPELQDLLRAADYALNYPNHSGHAPDLPKEQFPFPPRHPGPGAKVPGFGKDRRNTHGHGGLTDAAAHLFQNRKYRDPSPPPLETKMSAVPYKIYTERAAAEADLAELQLHRDFQDAFLLEGWNAAGEKEWLLGIQAPRLGRMLLIAEDQLEAAEIDKSEKAAAAGTN